jgi:hypothetical protein
MNLAPVVWEMDDFEVDDGKNEDDELKKIYKEDDKVIIWNTWSIQ